jgi:uncharacterized protein (UPF0218 family)
LLRKTFGVLYKCVGDDTIQKLSNGLGETTKLISVGDVTTLHLSFQILSGHRYVDDRTKRGPASASVVVGTKHTGFCEIFVDNPPGVITEDLIDVVHDAIKSEDHVRIFVRGEEDLAALPAILLAPEGSVVLYGQPDEGVVFVSITKSKKEEILDLLDKIISGQEDRSNLIDIRRKFNGC